VARPRRARAIHTVCCDMWSVYIDAVEGHLPQAALVFDRFHLSQHLSRAVDEVRRQTRRQLPGAEKAEFKHTRFLWLKNPENLAQAEHTRLSALLRLNSPIVRAYLLKEDFRRFWSYRSTAWAGGHLLQWLWLASHSRLEPFKKLARMLRGHLDGVLVWTKLRLSNGALEGMNNKVKSRSSAIAPTDIGRRGPTSQTSITAAPPSHYRDTFGRPALFFSGSLTGSVAGASAGTAGRPPCARGRSCR